MVEDHQTPDIRAIERGEFLVGGRLRQQHELGLRRELCETAQQFQHEHLGAAVFPAGKDRRQIDHYGSQLIGGARIQIQSSSCQRMLYAESGKPLRVS